MSKNKEKLEGDLVPTLRQGIDIIKMVLFKDLKPSLENRYPQMPPDDIARLTGAVVNSLFCIENMEKTVADFMADHQHTVQQELKAFASNFDHLTIPLTDALRIQYLCDCQEGIDSEAVLEKARKFDILIKDRDVPLPGAFMSMVRSFGVAYKILEPMKRE
ncbi:MAG: hypothetical protein ABFS43_15345 [Thermodesulfobacteriota bacterium]